MRYVAKGSDIINKKFGNLVVEDIISKPGDRHKKYRVKCLSCGCKHDMFAENVRRHAKTNSLGCKRCYSPSSTHGMSRHKFFKVWESMVRRCYSKKHESYHRYGERGISVCEKWRSSPEEFLKWLDSNGYKKGLEIDRRDNDGNYSPKNCRVVTPKKNKNNTCKNIRINFNGKKMTISEVSEITGIGYTTIRERIKRGWSHEDACSMPLKYNGKMVD